MRTALVLLMIVCLGTLVWGQPPDTLWTRTFYDHRDTQFNSVCALSDGGCAATGHCCVNLFHGFYASAYAVRVDAQGMTLWEHNYWLAWGNVQAPFVEGFAVQPVAAGGAVVGIGANGWPPFGAPLLRLDDGGEPVWVALCDPEISDPFLEITSVCNAAGGGFAATLYSRYDSARVARVNVGGHLLWRRVTPDAVLRSILPLPDNGFVVAGGPGFFIARLDSMGDTVWTRRHDIGTASNCSRLLARSGGYLMLGSSGDSVAHGAVATVDDNGNLLQSRLYDFTPGFVSGVHCTEGGDILLSDRLVRLNDNGDTLWTRTMPCADCSGTSIAQTTDSGFVVAGRIAGFASDSGYLMKFSREGLAADPHFILHPSAFSLSAFPNPFNPTTTLSFALPKSARTKIVIYNVTGREVKTLSDQVHEAGEHRIAFDGSALPSGIYFARMQSGKFAATQKLLLLK